MKSLGDAIMSIVRGVQGLRAVERAEGNGSRMLDLHRLKVTRPKDQIPYDNYTFFIVPFTYSVEAAREKETDRVFCVDSPSEGGFAGSNLSAIDDPDQDQRVQAQVVCNQRSNYLLPETRLTLFKRARWFRLRIKASNSRWGDELKGTVSYALGDDHTPCQCSLTANVELVLFEWPSTRHRQRRASKAAAPSAVGFLLFAAHIDSQQGDSGAQSRLEHLLNCNERLRYMKEPPYSAVDCKIELTPFAARTSSAKLWDQLLMAPLVDIDGRRYKLSFDAPMASQKGAAVSGEDGPAFARSYPDDRAFVYTFACLEGPVRPIELTSEAADDPEGHLWQRAWFNLLDIDGAPGSWQNKALTQYERTWLGQHTYARWRESGTLYGFTDFSAAQLMRADKGWNLTYAHFRQMYLDQLLLLLYERVTLFQFSAAISDFSHNYIERRTGDIDGQFSRLRQRFMFMTNLYQFPMFTTQQQGLEMYAVARASLSIKELYDEVSTEIHETDASFAQRRDEQRNRQLATIQRVGAVVAFGALTLTGLQVLEVNRTQWTDPTNLIVTAMAAIHHPLDIAAVRAAVSVAILLGASGVIVAVPIMLWSIGKGIRRWIKDTRQRR